MSLFHTVIVKTLPLVPKPIVGAVAKRYVAGETLEQGLDVVAELNREGAMATMDVLGEEVRERDRAEAAVSEYLRMLGAIAARGVDSNISIKPTMLGLKIDESLCRDHVERLVIEARRLETFVRIDMEDHTTTDATLRIYRELQERYGNVGCVLQSYMRRTLADIDRLAPNAPNVRLCKGIYIEPRDIAWKGHETVRLNFLQALEKLFAKGVYVGIATHDEHLVCGSVGLIERMGVPRERYEFQMLLGVDPQLRRILLRDGHRLRVYVPWGRDWYPYSMRRLRENPEVAGHVVRAFLGLAPR